MRRGAAILLLAVCAAGCGGTTHSSSSEPQLDVRLGLKRDQAGLERFALRVNDPASPAYGRFPTSARLAARFGASQADRSRVLGFLRGRGLTARVDATGAIVETQMTRAQARKLFGVDFVRRTLADRSRVVEPRRAAKVPRELRGSVEEVVGLAVSTRPPPGPGRPKPQLDPERCAIARKRSGEILRRYGISQLHARGLRGQGMTIAITAVDAFDRAALGVWARCLGIEPPAVRAIGRVKENVPFGSAHELELDLDTVVAAAPRAEGIELVVFDPSGWAGEPFLTALDRRGGPPDVISTSETYCEQALPPGDRRLADWVLAAAAAEGVTVVAASGDTGSSGCYPERKETAVQYPASSAFVTGVGGTQLTSRREAVWAEPGAHQAGGGGKGTVEAPSYQHRGTTRTVPDVAYVAEPDAWPPIPVCDDASNECQWSAIGGTSASAPLVAAGAALVKEAARRGGRVEPGLLNPLLYRRAPSAPPSAVHDVVDGSNDLFGTGCCSAKRGYDEASGWGAVDFAALLSWVTKTA